MNPGQIEDNFVRNDEHKKSGIKHPLLNAFKCAFAGLFTTLRYQRNVRIYAIIAVLAILNGFILRISFEGWFAIIICIVIVFSAECLNTAIEAIVDLVSPEYHDLAKTAKDCAAAAVLVCGLGAVVVGLFVYGSAAYGLFNIVG